MAAPDDRKYSKEHEWVLVEQGSQARIGITHHAQDQLGDVVFLELPPSGTRLQQFQKLGEVESVKAVSDLYSPVSGEVIDFNQEAQKRPELVNEDPYGKGWLLQVNISDPAELDNLLSAHPYEEFLAQGQ